MSIKLDADGNINTAYLEKELQSALEFDLKYKQTDSMKKRAVKVAGSYDEFKNMVACAHLKTLDREEVESLRHVKKGWQKAPKKKHETTTIEKENEDVKVQQIDCTNLAPKKVRKPKTSMEFERDWRRLNLIKDKHMYLKSVGIKRVRKLLKHDISAETLEDMLGVLLNGSNENTEDDSSSEIDLLHWLKEIISFDRFALTIRLVDSKLCDQVIQWLSIYNGPNSSDVDSVRSAFLQK